MCATCGISRARSVCTAIHLQKMRTNTIKRTCVHRNLWYSSSQKRCYSNPASTNTNKHNKTDMCAPQPVIFLGMHHAWGIPDPTAASDYRLKIENARINVQKRTKTYKKPKTYHNSTPLTPLSMIICCSKALDEIYPSVASDRELKMKNIRKWTKRIFAKISIWWV